MLPSGLRKSCESSDSILYGVGRRVTLELTRSVSWAAMYWMGMRKSRNRIVRPAKPFAARVWTSFSKGCASEVVLVTYYDTVVPSKDGEFVQAGDKVPASGDVSGEEDAKGED